MCCFFLFYAWMDFSSVASKHSSNSFPVWKELEECFDVTNRRQRIRKRRGCPILIHEEPKNRNGRIYH